MAPGRAGSRWRCHGRLGAAHRALRGGRPGPSPIDREHPYQGSNLGLPYDLAGTRLRYLGGTSNHWGGWCRPLDPSDFAAHEHIPLSGWPITRDDLNPYLEAALGVCEVPDGGLGLQAFEHDFGYEGFLHKAVPEFQVKNFLFSPPTRFGTRYLQELQQAEDIECYLNSSLVRLAAPGNAVDNASVTGPDGSETQVRAGCHVLAMGAIENARMLLHSDVANGSGFVGRCFADHLGRTVGIALLDFKNRYLLHHVRAGETYIRVLPHLSLAEDALREGKFANFGVVIDHKATKSLPLGEGGKQVRHQLGLPEPRATPSIPNARAHGKHAQSGQPPDADQRSGCLWRAQGCAELAGQSL